jgi:hypothetical protein
VGKESWLTASALTPNCSFPLRSEPHMTWSTMDRRNGYAVALFAMVNRALRVSE